MKKTAAARSRPHADPRSTRTGPDLEGGDPVVVVDPVAGTATVAGTTGGAMLYGLGYDETADVLYGFSASSGKIVTIDPATAASQQVPGGSRIYWWGATTNPVVW